MQIPANNIQFSEDTAEVSGVDVSFERLPHQCRIDEFLKVGEIVDVVADGSEVADVSSNTVADQYDISLGFVFIDDNLFIRVGKGRLEAGCYDLRGVFEADELALSVN